MSNLVQFTTSFDGWSSAFETFPIYSETSGVLVGTFAVDDGPVWRCSIAKTGYPESLRLTAGDSVWLTPEKLVGEIISLTLSDKKLSSESKQINMENL
jgi:hypothetical protein